MKTVKVEQADGPSEKHRGYHAFLKRRKVRIERRRAKHDVECIPAYNRFRGYET